MGKVRLGDICTIRKGTKIEPVEHCKSAIRFIQIDDLRNDGNVKYCLQEKRYVTAKPEDIIIAWDGANAGTIGFGLEGAIGSTLALIILNDKSIDTRFLGLFLKGSFSYLKSICTGATIPHINRKSLDDILIPKYPLEEQRKIAETLDAASELLAMRKNQLTELDKLIQSVFYDMFGDPVTNEKGWEIKALSDCCVVNPKKSEFTGFTDEFEVSFVSMTKVSELGEIDTSEIRKYSEVKTGYTYFFENDVLFAKITPCMENGKGAIARNLKNKVGFGSTEFHVLRPVSNQSNSEWLYRLTALTLFRKDAEKNMTGTAGQKRVPTSYFDKFVVPLPPFSLQSQFAETVQKIEEQKTLVQIAVDETQVLFDSLMNEYFE